MHAQAASPPVALGLDAAVPQGPIQPQLTPVALGPLQPVGPIQTPRNHIERYMVESLLNWRVRHFKSERWNQLRDSGGSALPRASGTGGS